MALTDFDLASGPASVDIPALRSAYRGGSGPVLPANYFSGGAAPAAPFSLTTPITLSSILNRNSSGVPSLATPATQPLVALTKSQPIQQQITTATGTNAANAANANESLTDFTKNLIASRGKVNAYGDQEQAAVSDVYDPNGLAKRLADLNRQRQAAVNIAAQSAVGRAIRANNVARMQSGNSSYLDRALAQQLADINTNAAVQGYDQSHADEQYLADQRQGAIGRRQQIIDSILQRDLVPAQTANQFQAANLSNLGALANLEYGNNSYQAPEDFYANRLNFLDYLRSRPDLVY